MDQGDYDIDGIDFDSTTLTDMPQNIHSRGPSEVQKQDDRVAPVPERIGPAPVPHPLTQHPQSSGLQDELARKLKERNQVRKSFLYWPIEQLSFFSPKAGRPKKEAPGK